MKYSSLDNVITMISNLGPNAWVGKIDLKSAFRLLIVPPSDFDLLGINFEGKFYIDKCLPNGLLFVLFFVRKMFEFLLAMAVIQETGLITAYHYLDDFIFVGGSFSTDNERLMSAFTELSK